MDRYEKLVAALREEIPGFRVVRKDQSTFHRAIHYALIGLTFGQMRTYLDSFQTTIGKTVYVTADWDEWEPDERYATMRHEAVHLRQFKKYTLPVMAVLYVLLPLPMGLAYFRARFEMEAYAETIRANAELYGVGYVRGADHRKHVIGQFMGPSYGWMWPFRRSLDRWYDRIVATIDEQG